MKQGAWIGFVVALLMAACSSSPSASVRYASPDPSLAVIDSLMWTQPDSAFAQLQVFAESHEVDRLSETQIAVLLDRDYSTIIRGCKKLQNALKTRKDVLVILNEFALNK